MIIGIDARFYGTENTGLGRYTQNILKHFFSTKDQNTYIVFVYPKYQNLTFADNVKVVPVKVKHYTLMEQIIFPLLLIKYKVDLFYTLHFNAPIFTSVPLVVTVHDLIKSHFSDIKTSTHTKLIFQFKRLGYRFIISQVLQKAQKIIVPSFSVKNDITKLFPSVSPSKIYPVYEAVDPVFVLAKKITKPPKSKRVQLLFVGNVYPHKNLPVLLSAFRLLRQESQHYYLTLLCKKNAFLQKILASTAKELLPYITIKEVVSDQTLLREYIASDVLVTPSLMEGFGLPGIEALSVGTPVVASDIPVYREVYQDYVTYFDPYSPSDLAQKIKQTLNSPKKINYQNNRTWADVANDVRRIIL